MEHIMTAGPNLNPTKRFSNRVDDYIRYRPGYPREIIELLQEDCGLSPAAVIGDIGSGTGKLSELFLQNGHRVYGVEPNKEMREAGERLLQEYPNFISVNGAAEATTLAARSVDFITAGQAFHWFDQEPCRAEFQRVLKRNGWVVIIWNDRREHATPFGEAYEKLLLTFATDYAQVRNHRADDVRVRSFFPSEMRLKEFPNSQQFDFDSLKGRLMSSSYAPVAGQPKHEGMLAELKRIFDAHQRQGLVAFDYDTRVYYGKLA